MLGAMLLFFGKQENISGAEMVGHAAYLLGAFSVALWTLAGGIAGRADLAGA